MNKTLLHYIENAFKIAFALAAYMIFYYVLLVHAILFLLCAIGKNEPTPLQLQIAAVAVFIVGSEIVHKVKNFFKHSP